MKQPQSDDCYPPVAPHDLINARGFENIQRVVVTQKGVYGRTTEGLWIEFRPLNEKLSRGDSP